MAIKWYACARCRRNGQVTQIGTVCIDCQKKDQKQADNYDRKVHRDRHPYRAAGEATGRAVRRLLNGGGK